MTPLEERLVARIAEAGPIPLDDFMRICLTDPEHGYYTTYTDPIGLQGDFVTGPEISQMFGEMLGVCIASCWAEQGRPERAVLAEFGPGRGTLMSDALRAARVVPGFLDAVEVHFVEASPRLRAEQAAKVPNATWHDTPDTLPDLPFFLLANEFFDALPIRQFMREGRAWVECMIGLEDGKLAIQKSDPQPRKELAHRLADTADGDIVEISAPSLAVAGQIGQRIATRGGAALIVDYGGWRSLGDTLQAMSRHETVGVLQTPGQVDLTAHVDFEALARAAYPARHTRLETQGAFLEKLGITARAEALAGRAADEAQRNDIAIAHRRLTHPDQMGQLFKVLGLYPEGAAPPPGLDP